MTEIHLDGVALRQHEDPYLFDYRPYAHQLEVSRLVREESTFVAVNDSPTGGGKTSSWLAPVLAQQVDTIAIYPTNALVIDQTSQVKDATEKVDKEVRVLTVTSEKLAKKRQEYGVSSNGEAFERWYRFANRRADQLIVLINPDILVMFCRDLYRNPARAYKQFPFVVVDEFHRAGRKEQNTLRYLLDELCERDNHYLEKVLFLSATPDEDQERKFRDAMSPPYHRIRDATGDEYLSFTGDPGDGWMPAMPPVDLDLRPAPTFGTAEKLLNQDSEETLELCREGRVAIILDGIHEVARVTEWLTDELDRRIERIDGFHSDRKKEKLERFDVLVSNSAVEVGIDFDIDRLLFAGHDRDSFLQRLGRLRTRLERCQARCYVPTQVMRKLRQVDGEELTREELDNLLGKIYPNSRKPASFDWRYSAPEALEHLDNRLKHTITEQKESVVRAAKRRIQRHFLDGTTASLTDKDVRRAKEALDWRILNNLQWYRGDSVEALVYDQPADAVRSYNLFYLLRYGDVQFVGENLFMDSIPEDARDSASRQARYVDGFCLYNGTIETTEEGWGRSVAFTGPRLGKWLDESTDESNRQPRVLPGIKLSATPNDGQPRVQSLDQLNDRLRDRRKRLPGDGGGILCYPIRGHANMIQEQYDLSEFFFLYPVALGGQSDYSLALGTDALYLHCHVMDQAENRSDDGEFIGL